MGARNLRWIPLAVALFGVAVLGRLGKTYTAWLSCATDSTGLTGAPCTQTIPYISDSGATVPMAYIFIVGMCINGGGFALVAILNMVSFRRAGVTSAHAMRCTYASVFFGVIAGVCAALLACLDTRNFPDPHLYAAIAFFLFGAIYLTLVTVAYFIHYRSDPDAEGAKRSAFLKVGVAVFFWINVIIYLPVGLSILGSECWVHYAGINQWDYSACVGLHHMRTITQYLSVFSLILFQLSVERANYVQLLTRADQLVQPKRTDKDCFKMPDLRVAAVDASNRQRPRIGDGVTSLLEHEALDPHEYWSYEYCPGGTNGDFVRQYRMEFFMQTSTDGSKGKQQVMRRTAEVSLGRRMARTRLSSSENSDGVPMYLERFYTHGSGCQAPDAGKVGMSKKTRSTAVRFYCGAAHEQQTMTVFAVEEPRMCEYIMHVSVPLLCNHPQFSRVGEIRAKRAARDTEAIGAGNAERDDEIDNGLLLPRSIAQRFLEPQTLVRLGSLLDIVLSSDEKKRTSLDCVRRANDGWWTFEFCATKRSAQQFAANSDRAIQLGVQPDLSSAHVEVSRSGDAKYYAERYTHGTPCTAQSGEEAGKASLDEAQRREVEVRYSCRWAAYPELVRVDEPAKCKYRLHIDTPFICLHDQFRSQLPRTKQNLPWVELFNLLYSMNTDSAPFNAALLPPLVRKWIPTARFDAPLRDVMSATGGASTTSTSARGDAVGALDDDSAALTADSLAGKRAANAERLLGVGDSKARTSLSLARAACRQFGNADDTTGCEALMAEDADVDDFVPRYPLLDFRQPIRPDNVIVRRGARNFAADSRPSKRNFVG